MGATAIPRAGTSQKMARRSSKKRKPKAKAKRRKSASGDPKAVRKPREPKPEPEIRTVRCVACPEEEYPLVETTGICRECGKENRIRVQKGHPVTLFSTPCEYCGSVELVSSVQHMGKEQDKGRGKGRKKKKKATGVQWNTNPAW